MNFVVLIQILILHGFTLAKNFEAPWEDESTSKKQKKN